MVKVSNGESGESSLELARAHDVWFRARVAARVADGRAMVRHEDVMAAALAVLAGLDGTAGDEG